MDQYLHIGPHLHKFVNFDFSDTVSYEFVTVAVNNN